MVIQRPDGTLEFTFIRPQAEHVSIAGDFNGWQPNFKMTRVDHQRWRMRLTLGPGVYQFRYCADGKWFNDYAAFGLEHGPFGLNSVVKVERAKRRPPAPLHQTPSPDNRQTTENALTTGTAKSGSFAESTFTDDRDLSSIYRLDSTTKAAVS